MSDLRLEFQENSRYLRYNELPVTGDGTGAGRRYFLSQG